MERMTPKGLEQSPQKPFTDKPQKVEEVKLQPIQVFINWLDAIRLIVSKKIENIAFNQYQESIGKSVTVGGSVIGGGVFASINWGLLLTGNVFEIIKLVIAVGSVLVGWFWKK